MPQNCVNNANNFCYICGEITFASQKCSTIAVVKKKAYHVYFGCKIGDQEKNWAPHYCCITCATYLYHWLNKKKKSMPFAVPMVWREPTNHSSNCYFCTVPPIAKGISGKKKWTVEYPNIPSALCPVPHGKDLPIPDRPESYSLDSDDEKGDEQDEADPNFSPPYAPPESHLISQSELNDLVRGLELPKTKAELLGSRLQQWNLII